MSTIRRQSIIASFVIYFGFAVGLLNIYFFTKQGLFEADQYGLTTMFVNIAMVMMAFANMAMPAYIYKFFPYYIDNVEPKKNDMFTLSLIVSATGFLLVMIAGWIFRDLVIRKFSENSKLLVDYYAWIFPMGFGLTVYSILEGYAWSIGKPVITSFLKEVQWRLLTTVLIVLFMVKVIPDFDLFIKLYAFTYVAVAATLFGYLIYHKRLHLTFRISKLTRRLRKKIIALCLYFYSGTIIFTLSQVFDSIVIAAVLKDGLPKAGIFGLATILTSVIQAPQRGIVAAAIPHLSRAWKDKNLPLLQKIYQRSSINLLIFACGIYLLIAINYTEAIITFRLQEKYLLGFNAFLLLGLTRVIDLGTGLNTEIISTSNYWRFQLLSGIVLLVLMVPLTILLTRRFDILGPAIANFVAISIYNAIRIIFLWKKFKLFPFTPKSLYTLLAAAVTGLICYFAFNSIDGIGGMMLRSTAFIGLYLGIVIYFDLSPDIRPVWETVKKRTGKILGR